MRNELRLSEHFTLSEMLRTHKNVTNRIGANEIDNIIDLVHEILEPLRDYVKTPIIISSGYRSPALNLAVGGSATSQHLDGQAVDFKCADMVLAFDFIKNNLEFDQLIWEYGTKFCPKWIHVSYRSDGKNRKSVFSEGVGH